MAKDPAILFYTSDFLTGTLTMTNEEVGQYIRLLCLQHQKGRLTEKDMLFICSTYVESVFSKFTKDGKGLYYNERLEEESNKRKKYSESRKKNISKRYEPTYVPTYVVHMENENVNENRNVINKEKVVESSSEPTIDEVKQFFKSMNFPVKDAESFYSYYAGQNWETTSGMNVKKTWQKKVIGWMNNQKQFTKYPQNEPPPQPKKEKYCHCGKEAVLWSGGVAGCSYAHILEAQKQKDKK